MKTTDKSIIVEQTFNQSIETVWNSITRVELMRQWFFDNIPAFESKVGFETQFNIATPNRNFIHLWRVTEVIPLKKITSNWKYEGYQGDSFVTFELFRENDLTKLKLTTKVVESFPEDIPEFKRESGLEGWNYFICKKLKEFLEK